MNRIEQVAPPIPAQPQPQPQPQPQRPPRLPRARRGTSGVAVAIAALAVPLLPGMAFGTTAAGGPGAATPEAPSQARHHLPHGQDFPGPGALTIQAWTTSGWTLTVPVRDGRYAPWLGEPGLPIDHPRPVVLPDGTRGEIADYRMAPSGLRADVPRSSEARFPETGIPAGPADSTGSDGSDGSDGLGGSGGLDGSGGSTGAMPLGGTATEWPSGDAMASRTARSRVIPEPLVPFTKPTYAMRMEGPSRSAVDIPGGAMTPAQAVRHIGPATAAALPASSYCLRDGYPAGGDRFMAAHLRPAADAMDVVVTPHRTPCGVRVDYLSQARA